MEHTLSKSDPGVGFIHFRFALIVLLSLTVMFMDVRSDLFKGLRYYVETALYPLTAFADAPHTLSRLVSSQLKSQSELIAENETLAAENYRQRAQLLRLEALEAENAAMRKLLDSPRQRTYKMLFGEVIDVDSDPYLNRIMVNQGGRNQVFEGMPVVSDVGLLGQVIAVNHVSSRVQLINDPNSAVPVVDAVTGTRAIVMGSGTHGLIVNNVPRSADVRVGDRLITSGLGGTYPEGYPVATVTSVGFSETQPFALITADPVADIDRVRYVLMLWYVDRDALADKPAERAKLPTDGKAVLHHQRVQGLIDSLTSGKAADARAAEAAHAYR